MKKKNPKQLQELYKQWFYKIPGSRYNRFCLYCNHRGGIGDDETFCDWYGKECFEAVRCDCPIPSGLVTMLLENNAAADLLIQRKNQCAKGGTVVPPSKFHFVTTECVETQYDREKCSRPHGSARVLLREDTPNGHIKKEAKNLKF